MRRRFPAPLALLLGAVAIALLAWALLTPPFMVPDEAEHFAYAQSLAEDGERPPRGRPSDPYFSTEQRVARTVARTTDHTADRSLKPAWEPSAERAWRTHRHGLPRDDIVALSTQSDRPPFYYWFEVVPYWASPSDDPFDRLIVMRLWSGLLMLVTTAGAWLLIGELTRNDRLLQLAGAACVGLQPMATFMSAGVNPDAPLLAAYSVALWLMARMLRRGWAWPDAAGLLAAALAAVVVKAAGIALVPAMALVLFVSVGKLGRRRLAAGTAAAIGLAFVGGALALQSGLGDRVAAQANGATVRGFGTYLWDFYLPRLPFQHEYPALHADYPAWTVWVKFAWGSFGFLEVQFPAGVYVVLALVSVAVAGLAVRALAAGRLTIGRPTLAIFAVVSISLVVGLHWVDFRSVDDDSGRVIQGRYLLPLMPLVGVAVAAALSNLRARRELAAALVLAGMAALQLFSLAIVAGRYLA